MARPLRIEFAGALYHVTARGDRREPIHEDQTDREPFLGLLGKVVQELNWLCYAYCLMSNHYHWLIETPEGNLLKGMRQLNGVYTQAYNRRHGQVGASLPGVPLPRACAEGWFVAPFERCASGPCRIRCYHTETWW